MNTDNYRRKPAVGALAGVMLCATLVSASTQAGTEGARICSTDTPIKVKKLASDEQENLCEQHKGKVMLVVNTASKCAFTGQYEGLEKLYATYRDRGLVVLGFPSNDFGNQEPGTEKTIQNFCRMTYGVQFPMYAKTRVKGENASPLYQALVKASGTTPKWNFHKYLIGRDGKYVDNFSSFTGPESGRLIKAIEKLL